MKTKEWFRILRRIAFLLFAIAAVYGSIFWQSGPKYALGDEDGGDQDREWHDVRCYDWRFNFLGYGFDCSWRGNDCWEVGPCCPPDWECSGTGGD